jgi:hypothetical protein
VARALINSAASSSWQAAPASSNGDAPASFVGPHPRRSNCRPTDVFEHVFEHISTLGRPSRVVKRIY